MPQLLLVKLFNETPKWQRLAISLLFIYTLFAIYIFLRADSMIFLPQPASYQDPKDILKLPITPTVKISARYLPNPQSRYTLLYIHGNAEDLGDIRPLLDRLHGWGFSIFANHANDLTADEYRPDLPHSHECRAR